MEMNTRIQVEHPVTEAITGTDLVQAQLLVASGQQLPWRQEDIKINGWAIECRLNAEDIKNNFMPCPGKITVYRPPTAKASASTAPFLQGLPSVHFYDSMIAKLIAWAVRARKQSSACKRLWTASRSKA
jgi:acetyl-CoA carboxylase biotin carboxylase subunit